MLALGGMAWAGRAPGRDMALPGAPAAHAGLLRRRTEPVNFLGSRRYFFTL